MFLVALSAMSPKVVARQEHCAAAEGELLRETRSQLKDIESNHFVADQRHMGVLLYDLGDVHTKYDLDWQCKQLRKAFKINCALTSICLQVEVCATGERHQATWQAAASILRDNVSVTAITEELLETSRNDSAKSKLLKQFDENSQREPKDRLQPFFQQVNICYQAYLLRMVERGDAAALHFYSSYPTWFRLKSACLYRLDICEQMRQRSEVGAQQLFDNVQDWFDESYDLIRMQLAKVDRKLQSGGVNEGEFCDLILPVLRRDVRPVLSEFIQIYVQQFYPDDRHLVIDVNAALGGDNQKHPLYVAAMHGHHGLVRDMLEMGADPLLGSLSVFECVLDSSWDNKLQIAASMLIAIKQRSLLEFQTDPRVLGLLRLHGALNRFKDALDKMIPGDNAVLQQQLGRSKVSLVAIKCLVSVYRDLHQLLLASEYEFPQQLFLMRAKWNVQLIGSELRRQVNRAFVELKLAYDDLKAGSASQRRRVQSMPALATLSPIYTDPGLSGRRSRSLEEIELVELDEREEQTTFNQSNRC